MLHLQHDDAGVDGNDFQTMTPGQKIRTCKKKLSVYEAQVEKLKSSRYVRCKLSQDEQTSEEGPISVCLFCMANITEDQGT